MPDQLPWDLLDRYLAGTCTPAEHAEARAYLAAHPDEEGVLRRVTERVTHPPHRAPDFRAQWRRMLHRIDAAYDGATSTRRISGIAGQWGPRMGWYAVATLVVGAVVTLLAWTAGVHHVTTRVATSALTYTTGNGERANITLPDGSTVALSVASRLEVPADFVTGQHTVHLTGEAIFNVAHHGGAPFTVVAGGVSTRVLGTNFLIRHYKTDTTTVVAVREGKVAVRSAILTADRQAVVGQGGGVLIGTVAPGAFSFAHGVLTLENVPFPEAVTELDRWYDADIRMGASALAAQAVTGQFGAGSLTDLTDILAGTFNVRVVRTGRVVTLFPR